MRKLVLFLLLFSVVSVGTARAQLNPLQSHGAPTGTCVGSMTDVDLDIGFLYACKPPTWILSGGGTGLPAGCTGAAGGNLTCTGKIIAGTGGTTPSFLITPEGSDPAGTVNGDCWINTSISGNGANGALRCQIGGAVQNIFTTNGPTLPVAALPVCSLGGPIGACSLTPGTNVSMAVASGVVTVNAVLPSINSFQIDHDSNSTNPLAISTAATTNGYAFWLSNPGVFGHIALDVTTADAVNNYEFGIYSAAGSLLCNTTAAPIAGTGHHVVIAFASSCSLISGVYIFAGSAITTNTARLAGTNNNNGNVLPFTHQQLAASVFSASFSPPATSYARDANAIWFSLEP